MVEASFNKFAKIQVLTSDISIFAEDSFSIVFLRSLLNICSICPYKFKTLIGKYKLPYGNQPYRIIFSFNNKALGRSSRNENVHGEGAARWF